MMCYLRNRVGGNGYDKIPSMSFFYFESATLGVRPEGTFGRIEEGGEEEFCLMVKPDEEDQERSVVGAYQQIGMGKYKSFLFFFFVFVFLVFPSHKDFKIIMLTS